MLISSVLVQERLLKSGLTLLERGSANLEMASSKRESQSVTPSMNSVMSQIRKCVVGDELYPSEDELQPLQDMEMKRKLSEETTTTLSTISSDEGHPLAVTSVENDSGAPQPVFKGLNMVDLDLDCEWTVDDIIQRYRPVYERRIRRSSVDFAINHDRRPSNSGKQFYGDRVELEQWPSAEENRVVEGSQELVVPNRRTRQRSLNPNFFKLYAIEMSCKNSRILPDINVDEQILVRLTYPEIHALDIQDTLTDQQHVTAEGIRLALVTRKKLWSDMMPEQRQDLFGDNLPWNLKFVAHGDQPSGEAKESSLVRVQSDLKPWMFDDKLEHNKMLKPCGKLRLGASPNAKEIQYVVKGWCDKRFASLAE